MSSPLPESEDVAFYCATLAASARSLPMKDALRLLHGALIVAGDNESMGDVRAAYMALHGTDEQLELIAAPQTKLQLNGEGAR